MKLLSLVLVCVLVLALSACSVNAADSVTPAPAATSDKSQTISATPSVEPPQTSFAEQTPVNIEAFDSSAFSGKITNAFYGADGEVLVIADYIYSYNPQSGKIKKGPEAEFDSTEVWPKQGGYAVIGQNFPGSTGDSGGLMMSAGDNAVGAVCILYDTSWKEINRIELSKLIAEGDMVLCADISEDGNTLALSTFDGLYSHDIASETTTRIVDCAAGVQADGLELVGMERISFTDNSHIAFLGGGWALPVAQGVQSETLYGTLATDGSGLTFKKPSGYSIGEELFVRGGKLFLPENFTKADGKLLTVDLNSGKETIYPLSYGGEGKDGVYVSDKGGAFATAALGGSELVVRVYDNNGNLMKTETLGNFDEFQLARTPVILLLEDSRTCIVLTGTRQDDINTGVTTFNY